MRPNRPFWGAAFIEIVLVTEALAMAWLVAAGLAGVSVAVLAALAVIGCLAVAVRIPRIRCRAAMVGLAVAAAAFGWFAIRSDAPGLVPAIVLTLLIIVAIALEERRQPGVEDIERELAARVDELARTKDQLLAVVSHEFRTPVTGVMGFAKTMSNHFGALDQDTMRLFVRSIEDHSTRLARLVDNLVVAADGVIVETGAVCDIHDVISSVVATVEDTSHEIHVSLRGTRRAQIDVEAARRVMANLVDNAVKFADDGTAVRVDARRLGDDVVIDVINVGPPLPADLRQRLYQPFVQADSSDSRRADGLGLGLHVVRQLVEGHGGRVELVESGGLVTFRVRLCAAARAVSGAAVAAAGEGT